MKVPINWLREFVNIPSKERDLTDKLTMVGHMLDKKTIVNSEVVVDLELRGNRADCYSILGIAREVAAIFNTKVKDLKTSALVKGKSKISLSVKTPLVKRVGTIEIKNVKIQDSPKWLKDRITAYGMESINNIVDLTNYVMIETGEPMHAFDLDKIGDSLEIRLAKNGEKLTTFTGDEITLTNEDLVWAKKGTVLSVAGAVGEKYNSISNETKNILLEAANYERSNIRRTVYRHKLLTEAGIRHEKELDPNLVDFAISRYLYLIEKNKWGEVTKTYTDYYPKRVTEKVINFDFESIKALGGLDIDKKEAINILKRLNFVVSDNKIKVPTYRTDVVRGEDVVEEVLRIYGYDKIPARTISFEIPKDITPLSIVQESSLRKSAIGADFSEVISSTFVKESMSKYNVHPDELGNKVVSLQNPPSPDNKNLRISLFPNLYELAIKAINQREETVKLFEIGKIYFTKAGKYEEKRKIGFIFKGSFENFKEYILKFLERSGLGEITFTELVTNMPLSYQFGLKLGSKVIGFGGRTEEDIEFIEIDLDLIINKESKYRVSLWPKYPPQIEDFTFVFPEKTKVGEVMITIGNNCELREIYNDAYTFRVYFQDKEKTLNSEEVNILRTKILEEVKEKFGGNLKV